MSKIGIVYAKEVPMIKVKQVKEINGKGTPLHTVIQYWTKDGILVAEGQMTQRIFLWKKSRTADLGRIILTTRWESGRRLQVECPLMPANSRVRVIRSRICLKIWQQMVQLHKCNIEVLSRSSI